MSKPEHNIQNAIRIELSRHGVTTFRANSGYAWASNDISYLPDGSILMRDPRPFHALPPGFSDLFGITPKRITPEDVGRILAVFTAIEVKQPGKKPSDKQRHFIEFVGKVGGFAGVARSVEEALDIAKITAKE